MKIPVLIVIFFLQEREFKEALEAYNEKNKEKAMYISKLVEVKHSVSIFLYFLFITIIVFWFFSGVKSVQLVTESEKLRMTKLDELSKGIDVSLR